MGEFDNASSELPQYKPVTIRGVKSSYEDLVDRNSNRAMRPTQEFQSEINEGVKEQSNLLGPSNPESPELSALQARSRQIQDSAVSQMMRQSASQAVDRQNQLQGKSIDQQAALFANAQQRAQIHYKQVTFQRQAAIQQEVIKRQLYGELFGGAFKAAAMIASAGISSASNKDPVESGGGMGLGSSRSTPDNGVGSFNHDQSMTDQAFGTSYNSKFGKIGGNA